MPRPRKAVKQAKEYLGSDRALDTHNIGVAERNEIIKELHLQGMPITEIGKLYRISKQRVSQILYTLGVSAKEKAVEKHESKELEEWKEKAERYLVRARRNREIIRAYNLKILNLQRQLDYRDRELEKVENFTSEIKKLQNKIWNLSEVIGNKNKKIEKLEKEIEELKNRKDK